MFAGWPLIVARYKKKVMCDSLFVHIATRARHSVNGTIAKGLDPRTCLESATALHVVNSVS